jgi:hypothetical protein
LSWKAEEFPATCVEEAISLILHIAKFHHLLAIRWGMDDVDAAISRWNFDDFTFWKDR